jgi:hypothetical protein
MKELAIIFIPVILLLLMIFFLRRYLKDKEWGKKVDSPLYKLKGGMR